MASLLHEHADNPPGWEAIDKLELRVDAISHLWQADAMLCRLDVLHQRMALAFGYGNWDALKEAHNCERGIDGPISEKMKALTGRHGYTLFRAMEAKRRD